ncbi:hypothetical protein FFLO_02479 [Filobasidium floriforme]|uniref:NADP-dependent oxidoreductase domain-containing protein n=1 Tax=Filobasidium floriforme TaxID=5210 RepID=A0A8K0NRS9_9TREE|nr:aldose reductase [Filobasidium floriforme]KAG7562100.1 hypothetical protein FFLO_02479 [Filobasidium floriforme]KAH8081816.1 aldose reductase [Filobasidium floriforme]
MSSPAWSKITTTLNTGAKMPIFGLGTWQSAPNEVRTAVKAALQAGYRHIDTAQAYGNEAEVGDGIIDSGVPREEIFLTTKIDNMEHKDVAKVVDESLKKLKTDYVDLILMHWPVSIDPVDRENQKVLYKDWNFVDTWREMEKIPSSKVKAIGVSNFGIENLKTLLESAKTVPAVNQCEAHINCPSTALVDFCKSKGIHFTAYSCLGSTGSPLANDKTLKEIAEKHNTSTQKVLLVWNMQRGEGKHISVIPKSVTPSRIEDNLKLDGLELSQEEMDKLNACQDRFKVCNEWLPQLVFRAPGTKASDKGSRDFYDKDSLFERE